MAVATTNTFLDLLRQSGIVEEERLGPFLDELAARSGRNLPETPEQFADALIEARLITRWHANKLLEGKHKGFFLGKYKLLSQIGRGGMSTVYLAEHLKMKAERAIKVLPQNRVTDASYLSRFYQEARAAAQLVDENIVRAFDVDNAGDNHFLVMEYIEGADLHVMVTENGPLDFEAAAEFVRQAANGIAHAHEVGLVHRDIKPANLLVDKKKTVKVLDMGLAKFTETGEPSLTLTHEEHVLGTADYLAPEQALDSHRADHRADIYSLGCTLYFLLTGHPPFNEGSIRERLLKHQLESPPSVFKDRPDAPPGLVSICNRMMSKKRENRYQSAGEVADVLTEWLSEKGYDVGGGTRGKRPKSLSGSGYPIGRLRRPIPTTPSSETVSASDKDTTKMRAIPDDDELGFAPLDESAPDKKAEPEPASPSSGILSSGSSTAKKGSGSDVGVGVDSDSGTGPPPSPSSKSGSSVISKSLIEEELESIPASQSSPGVAPGSSGPTLTPRPSKPGSKHGDMEVLIWAFIGVGALIVLLLLIAVIITSK
jgi:serine/threonine-protein kinase